ncbi:MAG: cupin domain-containing protein [Hyphomicrobiales bacterium]
MPVYRSGEAPPGWCELSAFDILDLPEGEIIEHERRGRKERLLATAGTTQLLLPDGSVVLKEGQFVDLPTAESWRLRACSPKAQLVRLSGRWGRDLGGCGIFRVVEQEAPVNIGDPVDYPKRTSVDSHYHDCDEYWILLEGGGTVVVGDRHMSVQAGDCVPIGMGHHHDLPLVGAPVKSVFFETTLEREKRVGHLWTHTHGRARPRLERI